MRSPTQNKRPKKSQIVSFPAPRDGWIANLNLSQPDSRKPDGTRLAGAAILDNYFPTATGIKLMRGSQVYAQLGDGSKTVRSLFSYVIGGTAEMFAATDDAVYNISLIVQNKNVAFWDGVESVIVDSDDNIFGWNSTAGLDVVTGQSGGLWSSIQFATAGGTFLRLVNGVDEPLVYDGTDFTPTPALTYPNTDPANTLNFVWAYKQRLFFVENGTLDAWFLPVDTIGGELKKIPLGGVFQRGGSLLFGASWSLDSGAQGGLSEQCIFVTTEGEVAVYQGANPESADDWSKVGVYSIGRPLGKNAWFRDGGDLIIATSIGMVRLSEAIRRELAALGPTAVSYPIETAWNEAVDLRSSDPWHCVVWPSKQMAVVALPHSSDTIDAMFVANIRTGAWARRTHWNGTCMLVFKERLFFGSEEGKVIEANITGLDDEVSYSGVCIPLFDNVQLSPNLKIAKLAHVRSLTPYRTNIKIATHFDFEISDIPTPPTPVAVGTGSEWGLGVWGSATWGNPVATIAQNERVSVSGQGYAISPSIQVSSGSIVPIDIEIVNVDITYEVGDVFT